MIHKKLNILEIDEVEIDCHQVCWGNINTSEFAYKAEYLGQANVNGTA
jgi:hypothetical protein